MNPLSSIYGVLAGTRNSFYDRGVFKSRKLSHPVISIGNLSVGGSGKTPFVILLGELLKQRGITFDVLSRGYGRETHDVRAVDPNGSPLDFGDEPLLIAQRLGCPVIVGKSRYEAGVVAEKRYQSQLHILDDGFQHRSLARDFDIVLLTPEDLKDQLLPAGRLREPLSSLHRAHALVLTEEVNCSHLPEDRFIWRVRRTLPIPETVSPKTPVVFCGIARPHKFVEQLRASGIHPVAHMFYRDHHRYTSDDIRDLLELRDRSGADGFISTQKDAINLGKNYALLAPIAFPIVQMELLNSADARDTILRVISERRASA